MASEYLKWKYRDVQPEEHVELTPEQKRKNWWHYHKWHLVIGAVALAAVVSLVLTMLGVGRIDPDYQFAYVATNPLPEQTAEALEAALATLGTDANGDGRVVVQLNQYAGGDESNPASVYYTMAATTKLMADFTDNGSYFFLLDDPQGFQTGYHALRKLDGSLPADSDPDWQSCCLRWTDCPALATLDLGQYEETTLDQQLAGDSQSLLSGLYVARRGFWSDDTCKNVEACDALWEAITAGANQGA